MYELMYQLNRVSYYYGSEVWLWVFGGALVVALIAVLVMKAGMRTANKATRAGEYIPSGGVHMRVQQDRFTHTTRHVIQHQKK